MQLLIHFFEVGECDGGTVEEFRGKPAFLITAVSDSSANRSLGAIHGNWTPKIGPGPPDSSIKGSWTSLIHNLTSRAGHFREGVVAAVALSPNHTRLTGALTRLWVAGA